jgi:Phage integrase, N-terminal SAM-like domain
MVRKVGQIIARGDRRWLIRVYLGRDRETNKRNYHNRTIHGSMREAQAYLTRKLRERDLGRDLEGAKITLNEYLDRWIQTAVKPRVREKTCQDYEGMLRRYIRPNLGERVLAAIRPLDLQTAYQQMMERGLSARTIRYTHVVLGSAMRQALQWRLLLENPADGVKVPEQPRNEMRALTVEQTRTLLNIALTTPYGGVLAVALTTGMRPSEYLALKWQDNRLGTTNYQRCPQHSATEWEMVLLRLPNVPEAVAPLNCKVGLLLSCVSSGRRRFHSVRLRPLTWCSKRLRGSQSMPIISPSISNQSLSWPVCHGSDSMIYATRQPQSRLQLECRPGLYRSS